jgi:molybdate-binding protein/molybdenum-dependent DNA-binding transcriptional regulator ModE
MSSLATSRSLPPQPIRWNWDFGIGLSESESSKLLLLLASLQTFQTLGKAAVLSELSYRSAWGLLRRCEQRFGQPLVLKGRGQGTRLSEFAARLLALDQEARSTFEALHAPWAERLKEVIQPSQASAPELLRIAASQDIALADWIEHGRHVKVDIFWRGSEEALAALSRGECDAAGFHVPDHWGKKQMAAWISRWLDLRSHMFFLVMRRQHGILTAAGNPYRVGSVSQIAELGLRMVNRQRGSGTRGMIDQLIAANGLQAGDIAGYAREEFTHDAVALTVANGQADVGFGIRSAAARYELDFVPLGEDLYCLAVRSGIANASAVAQLLRRFKGETFKARLIALTGYTPESGAATFLAWEPFAGQVFD